MTDYKPENNVKLTEPKMIAHLNNRITTVEAKFAFEKGKRIFMVEGGETLELIQCLDDKREFDWVLYNEAKRIVHLWRTEYSTYLDWVIKK
jgi:hypothetical protein